MNRPGGDGGSTQEYRVFFLDAAGRFRSVEEIEAEHDGAIVERARASGPECGFEVWQGTRFVGRFDAKAEGADGKSFPLA